MEYYLYKFPLVLVVPVGCVQRVPVFLSKPEPCNWTIYTFQKFYESESLHWSASTIMYNVLYNVYSFWCSVDHNPAVQPH